MKPLAPITALDLEILGPPTDRLREHILDGAPINDEPRAVANKQAAITSIAARLRGNSTFEALAQAPDNWILLDVQLPADAPNDPIERMACAIQRQWAVQHHDSGANWALLKAASDELGVPMRSDCVPEEGWHDSDTGYTALESESLQAPLRAFVRAMYDTTQAQLAELGVSEVIASRGVRYDTDSGSCPFQEGTSAQAPDLNALSAFSLDMSTALEFAAPLEPDEDIYVESSAVMAARVPASRIVSLPTSGLGSTMETELIIMGDASGLDKASVSTTSWRDGHPSRMNMPYQLAHLAVKIAPDLSALSAGAEQTRASDDLQIDTHRTSL